MSPNFNSSIFTSRRYLCTVGAPVQGVHLILMSRQRVFGFFRILHRPQLQSGVFTSRYNEVAVRGPRDLIYSRDVTIVGGDEPASFTTPQFHPLIERSRSDEPRIRRKGNAVDELLVARHS